MLRDSPRQGLSPRRHLRFEGPGSTTLTISCPARAPFRKTQLALYSSTHAHTLPFGAPAPPSPELYNRHPCESLSSRIPPAPFRDALGWRDDAHGCPSPPRRPDATLWEPEDPRERGV